MGARLIIVHKLNTFCTIIFLRTENCVGIIFYLGKYNMSSRVSDHIVELPTRLAVKLLLLYFVDYRMYLYLQDTIQLLCNIFQEKHVYCTHENTVINMNLIEIWCKLNSFK